MVAKRRSGSFNNSITRLSLACLLPFMSSRFSRVNEKNAISDPEAKAEHKRSTKATHADTIALNEGSLKPTTGCAERNTCENIFKHPTHSYTKTLIYSLNKLKENNNIKKEIVAEAKNITVKFPVKKNFFGKVKEYLYAVNNVTLKLKKGKTLGLVGESGSGKTTLAMSFAGLNTYEGSILYNNTNIKEITPINSPLLNPIFNWIFMFF